MKFDEFKIVAKSIIQKDELIAKLNLGVSDLEIQLLKEFEMGYTPKELFRKVKDLPFRVSAVHTPLTSEELIIEDVILNKKGCMIEATMELAQLMADKCNCRVPVILHAESSLRTLQRMETNWVIIINKLQRLLVKYPKVDISIENTTLINYKKDRVVIREAFSYDNALIAKELNDITKSSRFYTTIDTCHLLGSLKVLGLMPELSSKCSDLFEEVFAVNANLCNNIHLAYVKESGIKYENHGMPFDVEDKESIMVLDNILRLYKKYNYTCPLTLEVREEDYLNCVNFIKTAKAVKEVSSSLVVA